jgi:hypothetical protein
MGFFEALVFLTPFFLPQARGDSESASTKASAAAVSAFNSVICSLSDCP